MELHDQPTYQRESVAVILESILRERHLSQRLLNDYEAIVDATCIAWNKLKADVGRIASLTWTPWKTVSQK